MKLSHIILAGTALALSGCSKEKEKTDFEKQREINAKAISELLERYPKGHTSSYLDGDLLVELCSRGGIKPIFTTGAKAAKNPIHLTDINGDGAVETAMMKTPQLTAIFRDANNDGHVDYFRTVDTATKQLILEAEDTDGDYDIDIVIDGMTGKKTDLDKDLEYKESIKDLGDSVLMKVHQVFGRILEGMLQSKMDGNSIKKPTMTI